MRPHACSYQQKKIVGLTDERNTNIPTQMSIANTNSAYVIGNIVADQVIESDPQPALNLDLKHFGSFTTDGLNFDFKNYQNNSNNYGCIITEQYWNLSLIESEPISDAYFEITFTQFNDADESEMVGIGIGNQIFKHDELLGPQQNSFGYFNNGTVLHKYDVRKEYLPKFKQNDTIGAGILLDSFNTRRLYFTKNGQYLGVAPIEIHVGQDCFPGVTFVPHSMLKFTLNFTGPFKFDAKTLPNYRYDKIDRISNLPDEILFDLIINRAVTSYALAVNIRMVNKRLNEMGKDNRIWKPLFLNEYPNQNQRLNLRSWMNLFVKRKQLEKKKNKSVYNSNTQFIENCEFEFKCPISWSFIKGQKEDDERHCSKCNKTVYAVKDSIALQSYIEQGRCVSIVRTELDDEMERRIAGKPAVYKRSNPLFPNDKGNFEF